MGTADQNQTRLGSQLYHFLAVGPGANSLTSQNGSSLAEGNSNATVFLIIGVNNSGYFTGLA